MNEYHALLPVSNVGSFGRVIACSLVHWSIHPSRNFTTHSLVEPLMHTPIHAAMHSLRHACSLIARNCKHSRASRRVDCNTHVPKCAQTGVKPSRAHTKVALIGVMAGQALHGTQVGLECLVSLLLQRLLQPHQSHSQSISHNKHSLNHPHQLLSSMNQKNSVKQNTSCVHMCF